MKKLFFAAVSIPLVLSVALAQEQETVMYETIYLSPKLDKMTQLNENLSTHNKKYHGEGEYAAFVQNVLTGKRTGDYFWVMGPGNFARLDTRPAEDGHDQDWNDNVMPYLTDMAEAEYWRRDNELFYSPEDYSGELIRVRFYRIKQGMNQRFSEMFAKIVEVYTKTERDRPVTPYWNMFPTAYGRNAASASGIPNWASFDQPNTFVADFESINGEGSWAPWISEWNEINEWTDNEVRQLIPALSGIEN